MSDQVWGKIGKSPPDPPGSAMMAFGSFTPLPARNEMGEEGTKGDTVREREKGRGMGKWCMGSKRRRKVKEDEVGKKGEGEMVYGQ